MLEIATLDTLIQISDILTRQKWTELFALALRMLFVVVLGEVILYCLVEQPSLLKNRLSTEQVAFSLEFVFA